jgi:hypothetical protein
MPTRPSSAGTHDRMFSGHPAFTENHFDFQQNYNAQFTQTRFPGQIIFTQIIKLPETSVVWPPLVSHPAAHVIMLFVDPLIAADDEEGVSVLYFLLLQELQRPVTVL